MFFIYGAKQGGAEGLSRTEGASVALSALTPSLSNVFYLWGKARGCLQNVLMGVPRDCLVPSE
jgi:hypothetical protein